MFKKQIRLALIASSITFANAWFLIYPQLASAIPPHNPNLYYLDANTPMNVWEMTSYLDKSLTHQQQKIVQQICFTVPTIDGTHWVYDWYSNFQDWSGKARQEGDQIFMHGDYSKNNGHTSLQWEIVTQSSLKAKDHQTKGFGHCVDWQNTKVGSLGTTIIFANVKLVRVSVDEKCEKFREKAVVDITPMPILVKTACGVKEIIIKKTDDKLETK